MHSRASLATPLELLTVVVLSSSAGGLWFFLVAMDDEIEGNLESVWIVLLLHLLFLLLNPFVALMRHRVCGFVGYLVSLRG